MLRQIETIDARMALDDRGRLFFLPIGFKLLQLRQRGKIGHSIDEQLADEVIHFMLNADGIEARSFKI